MVMRRSCTVLALAVAIWVGAPRAQEAHDEDTVISRVSDYVQRYQRALAGVTATETYRQEKRGAGSRSFRRPLSRSGASLEHILPNEWVRAERTLHAHLLIIPATDSADEIWVAFRDVFEVDGRPVRQREERLKDLFLNPATRHTVRRLSDESARHNIGRVRRNFNTPLVALSFLHPDLRGRFAVQRIAEERAAGRRVWVLRLRERRRPTLIQSSRGENVPAEAHVVADPNSGEVLHTTLIVQQRRPPTLATITVAFTPDDRLGLRVPTRMEETYERPERAGSYTWGLATYKDFHRFTVETSESVKEIR